MSQRWTPSDLADYQSRRGAARIEVPDLKPRRRNKYHAKKTTVDGIVFDSKREATRYQDLKVLLDLGVITKLRLQVEYPLIVNGIKICAYRSDFNYIENGEQVVEDTKSAFTRKLLWYRMKKKLMLALHGIEIRET